MNPTYDFIPLTAGYSAPPAWFSASEHLGCIGYLPGNYGIKPPKSNDLALHPRSTPNNFLFPMSNISTDLMPAAINLLLHSSRLKFRDPSGVIITPNKRSEPRAFYIILNSGFLIALVVPQRIVESTHTLKWQVQAMIRLVLEPNVGGKVVALILSKKNCTSRPCLNLSGCSSHKG